MPVYRKIYIIVLILLICLNITGCQSSPSKEEKLEKIIEENNYTIVDVRTKEEYEESHLKGAINIPYDQIDENIELDKDKTILVYCKSGRRSHIAYTTLKDLNYEVFDLGAFNSINLEKE